MGNLHKSVLVAVCMAPFFFQVADAAIYYRGKEVLRDGKAVADIERLYWAPVPNSSVTDRIQGHIDINVNEKTSFVTLVFQVFDSKGKPLSAFSVTPKCCLEHDPSRWWRKDDWQDEVFPFCGVENSHVKIPNYVKSPKRPSEVEQRDFYKKGKEAWFYVDFPRNKNAQSMRIVNVVVNDKEVQYNVRFVANRLVRSLSKSPEIKHGTEAELGDESECGVWLPPTSGRADAAISYDKGNVAGSQTKRKQEYETVPTAGDSGASADDGDFANIDANILVADASSDTPAAAPLCIDVSSLDALRSGFTGKGYKCKALLDVFTTAIEEAVKDADGKREKLDRMVSENLGKRLVAAQQEGKLDQALAIKNALDAFPGKVDDGGAMEVAKVFDARNKRLAQIDKDLAQSVLASAKVLYAAMEEQKTNWTKNGELDLAKNIADFQRALSAWAKDVHVKVAATTQPIAQQSSETRNQLHQTVRENKHVGPEGKIVSIDSRSKTGATIGNVNAGDIVEFQYVGGKWTYYKERRPLQNPDDVNVVTPSYRLSLCKCSNGKVGSTLAIIPSGTSNNPFRYKVNEDEAGELALRINDDMLADNVGSVRYSVKTLTAQISDDRSESKATSGEADEAADDMVNGKGTEESIAARIAEKAEKKAEKEREEENERGQDSKLLEFTAGKDNKGRAVITYQKHGISAIIKNGETEFMTDWFNRTADSVWVGKNYVKMVGVNENCHSIPSSVEAFDKKGWDFSATKTWRQVSYGQVFVLVNNEDRFLAVKVISVRNKFRGGGKNEIIIEYKIY